MPCRPFYTHLQVTVFIGDTSAVRLKTTSLSAISSLQTSSQVISSLRRTEPLPYLPLPSASVISAERLGFRGYRSGG